MGTTKTAQWKHISVAPLQFTQSVAVLCAFAPLHPFALCSSAVQQFSSSAVQQFSSVYGFRS
jgi:hypothetical protein